MKKIMSFFLFLSIVSPSLALGRNQDLFELGRMLYFDKILSGNKNISCATCHHPLTFTGDNLSLPVGEGGSGLGMARNTGIRIHKVKERVPRNSPAIFNMGEKEITTLFHDGRIFIDSSFPSNLNTPAKEKLPEGLDSPIAAQALFPPTSATEMAGQKGENSIADAAAEENLAGENGVWEQLAKRLQGNKEYVKLFNKAYPQIQKANNITMVMAANAIGHFETEAFRMRNSAFDKYRRGNSAHITPSEKRGSKLFYGKAKCVSCHSGDLQTDNKFYAIAMPQIGAGKGDGEHGYEDFGRERVTGDIKDRYKFRTPSLRNVALTGPWGHSGAYSSLENVVKHHITPKRMLKRYSIDQALLPSRKDLNSEDMKAMNDSKVVEALLFANELPKVILNLREIKDLVNFLHCLTDKKALTLYKLIPTSVPSGLPVAD